MVSNKDFKVLKKDIISNHALISNGKKLPRAGRI